MAVLDGSELQRERLALEEEKRAQPDEWADDDEDRLSALNTLADDLRLDDLGDLHGPLIPESDFEDFAKDEAESIGAIEDSGSWPATCIDWARACDELKQDYESVEFDGETCWYRE